MLGEKNIPIPLYKQIYDAVPIFRVDVIAVDGREHFLLLKRTEQPQQGKWWFPGGRVLKNEPVHEAAIRKLEEETGLMGSFIRQVGFYELIGDAGVFSGSSVHTPVVVCLVKVDGGDENKEAELRWCDSIDEELHPHLQEMLLRAGFRKKS